MSTRCSTGDPTVGRARVRLPQCLPHFVGDGGRELAGPRHPALRSPASPTSTASTSSSRATGRTISSAFKKAGWETAAVDAVQRGSLAGSSPSTASTGPTTRATSVTASQTFAGFQTPDQYTLSAFQHAVRERPGRGPLMAEIPLVTSHCAVGGGPAAPRLERGGRRLRVRPTGGRAERSRRGRGGQPRPDAGRIPALHRVLAVDAHLLRGELRRRQPRARLPRRPPGRTVRRRGGAGEDVPITIVARDPAVLDRIADWGWQDGLRPGAQSPVWPMESFRDRFLTAFGKQ